MLPLRFLCFCLGGACVGLTTWLIRLKRALREAKCSAKAQQESGCGRADVLEEANEVLRCKHRALQIRFDELQGEMIALSYSVSHDLRAPLRSIEGFSQALVEDHGPQLTSPARDHLQRVRQAAVRMHDLIDALLDLGRLVRSPFQPEVVDLSALARSATLELSAHDSQRRVEWHIQPNLLVRGDRAQLARLLQNLLGNAHKFTRCRTVAHVSLRRQPAGTGAYWVYEVRDDGVGFDPQYAGKLFGVFQRLHPADEHPGQGVGLAAAQRIVRRHGGSIWATAEPDAGATFSFTLPALSPTLDDPCEWPLATGDPCLLAEAADPAGASTKVSAV